MKKYFFLVFILAFTHSAFCQLQNPSFELWDAGDPVYWQTSNFYDPGTATQSNDAHGGDFALSMNVALDSNGIAVAPYALNIFPLTTMPEVLTFWMKGNLQGNNSINASFTLIETDTNANILAYGDQTFSTVSNVYQYKFVNVLPFLGPSLFGQGSIYFAITAPVGNSLNVSSSVIIDDLYLGADNTGLLSGDKNKQIIEQLYPNPAREMAYLVFNKKEYSEVRLNVYDMLGNMVQEVLHENMPEGKFKAEINTSELNAGIYFCKLTIDGIVYSCKLIKQ
jgi:hypothetical protein